MRQFFYIDKTGRGFQKTFSFIELLELSDSFDNKSIFEDEDEVSFSDWIELCDVGEKFVTSTSEITCIKE